MSSASKSLDPSVEEIARDATWLAQALDLRCGLARLVRMTPETYRQEAFLDDRLFQQPRDFRDVPISVLDDAAALIDAPAPRWIFHIGHVGSTLVARLLGELPGVLSAREPRILRDIVATPDPIVEPVRRLMGRTFAPGDVALVKATSFVSEIAPSLINNGRALFMTADPAHYVASILAGENSLRELHILADSRARRMSGRVRLPVPRNDADLAAAAWACEASALEAAAQGSDAKVLWVDFDRALADLLPSLKAMTEALAIAAPAEAVEALAQSPLLGRYSKALDHAYSPSLRRQLIGQAAQANRTAIDSALAMLDRAAPQSPLLERALTRHGKS